MFDKLILLSIFPKNHDKADTAGTAWDQVGDLPGVRCTRDLGCKGGRPGVAAR